MQEKLIKGITLFLFTGLISTFVIYRSGIIDNTIQSSPNGGTVNTIGTDTTKRPVKRETMIPSSKVLIMTDQQFISTEADSAVQEKFQSADTPKVKTEDNYKSDFEIMGSSKSGVIFKADPVTDTAKKQKPRR